MIYIENQLQSHITNIYKIYEKKDKTRAFDNILYTQKISFDKYPHHINNAHKTLKVKTPLIQNQFHNKTKLFTPLMALVTTP